MQSINYQFRCSSYTFTTSFSKFSPYSSAAPFRGNCDQVAHGHPTSRGSDFVTFSDNFHNFSNVPNVRANFGFHINVSECPRRIFITSGSCCFSQRSVFKAGIPLQIWVPQKLRFYYKHKFTIIPHILLIWQNCIRWPFRVAEWRTGTRQMAITALGLRHAPNFLRGFLIYLTKASLLSAMFRLVHLIRL